MRKNFLNSRKLKYGAVGGAFTAAFIAIVVIFNVIFSALASHYMWYVDMTDKQLFTLSEASYDIMSDVTNEVNIYFASEPDVLMAGTNSTYTRYIYTTALQLAEAFDNVHVECVDVLKNPEFFREFYNTAQTDIDTDSVVVQSGSEVRVFTAEAFYSFDDPSDLSTVWAYNGEKKLISSILQVTQTNTPKVAFTTEHGENIPGAIYLAELFGENGFEVDTVNLTKDELDEDCRILIIFDPQFDFVGAEAEDAAKNEIEKIDSFLDDFGCLLVFSSPENAGNLKNLSEFLAEWGIAFTANTTVRDMEHSMSVDGYSVIAEYQKGTLGAGLYTALNELATPPKTIIRSATPIEILFESGGGINAARQVSAVLKSYSTSELVRQGIPEDTGAYNLATISRESVIVDNEYYYSHVMAFGSPSFVSGSYIQSNSFANEDIVSAAMKAIGRERVLAVIDRKPFDDSDITITTAEANRLTVIMTLAIPAVIALCGAVVIIRRKHS